MSINSMQVLKTEIDRSGEDKKGKFGRILGDFILDNKRLTDMMIEDGHAVAYFGGSKEERPTEAWQIEKNFYVKVQFQKKKKKDVLAQLMEKKIIKE